MLFPFITMGFLGPISADKLSATYDPQKHQLTLVAEGTVEQITYGISFERVEWVGGLKFNLEGWTGPLTGERAPYQKEQVVDIVLAKQVFSSDYVIIVTANSPQGQQIPIHWLGLDPQPQQQPPSKEDVAAQTPAATGPQTLSQSNKRIDVLLGNTFEIKQAAEVPKGGSVKIKFDTNYVNLSNADIEDTNIDWTFKALHTGHTQVLVTVSGGIAQFVILITYDVYINALDITPAPAAGTDTSVPQTEAILSFLGRVNIANRLVQVQYPDAQLYEVDATPNVPGPVTNPNELPHLRLVFNAPKDGKQGTAFISSIGWSEFGPVQWIGQVFLEDNDIPWPPPQGFKDATDADALLKKAGYTGPYLNFTLRQPTSHPASTEPYYIFQMANTSKYVSVGAIDGQVKPDA